jgi:putative MATE family efflux protein
MFGTGATAIVAKKLGEGRYQEAKENFTFIILFTALLGIGISAFALINLEKIIFMLGANDVIYDYCYAYALPLISFLPANIIQIQFQFFFVANGKPNIGLITTLIGGFINLILDYIFIVHFKLGIAGAALATGIGYLIPTVFGLTYFFINRKGAICFVKPKVDWRVLLKSMTNGSSEMVSNLSAGITTIVFNKIMMYYMGQDGVAAIAILLYADYVLIAANLGFSSGVAPLISYNYGAREPDKLKKIFSLSVKFCAILGIIVALGTAFFSELLTSVFTPKGSLVFELAEKGLRIYAISYLFKGINIFSSAMFTAFSNGKTSAILSFARTLVLILISVMTMTYIFGVNGIWYAMPSAEFLAFILAMYYVYKYRIIYHYAPK